MKLRETEAGGLMRHWPVLLTLLILAAFAVGLSSGDMFI